MVTEVAREIGPSFAAVWAQPYHLTLLAFLGLRDRERIEHLQREGQALDFAFLINKAVLEPRKLLADQNALRAKLQQTVGSARPYDPDELVADMQRLAGRLRTPPVS